MSREPAVRRNAASPITHPVSTLAIILAAILVWRSIVALSKLDLAARLFRLSDWLNPGVARLVVGALSAVGVVAAVALVPRRSRRAAAVSVMAGLLSLLVYSAAAWVWGRPLTCGCGGSADRGLLAQTELLVVIVGLTAVAAFVGFASKSMTVKSRAIG